MKELKSISIIFLSWMCKFLFPVALLYANVKKCFQKWTDVCLVPVSSRCQQWGAAQSDNLCSADRGTTPVHMVHSHFNDTDASQIVY